ncbi:hypothetical protein BC829DRAFT_442851 [Chytridium lagenaria]|nr:hypothetical protein BC829DRAFT_442851 [Chytridium lagenaria]
MNGTRRSSTSSRNPGTLLYPSTPPAFFSSSLPPLDVSAVTPTLQPPTTSAPPSSSAGPPVPTGIMTDEPASEPPIDAAGILRKTRSVTLPGIEAEECIGPDVEAHSDWVNDLVLCNQNRNMISASSDRMVYLWSLPNNNMHVRLGHHTDYIKALAYSSGAGWVASGGLDRRIILWNVGEARGEVAELEDRHSMQLCHDGSPAASIYALATNPAGSVVVSGSPEKVVKVWDPRSGKREIRLTGHTDNIRSLLVSDDGRWVLSASSDTTIKLWSLAQPQRCMVTYTHSQDSIWCLYSNHPDLETFWSGGRDGWVTKMTRRRIGGDSTRVGNRGGGVHDELVDCVAICRESGPVNKIVAIDDSYVWTATCKSDINRWVTGYSLSHATVVSSTDHIADDTDAIIIPSAAIIRQPKPLLEDERSLRSYHFSVTSTDAISTIPASTSSINPVLSTASVGKTGTSVNDWDSDDAPVEPVWDIVRCVRVKDLGVEKESEGGVTGAVELNVSTGTEATAATASVGVIEAESTVEWIANWCTLDTKNGYLTVHLEESKSYDAEMYHEDSGCDFKPALEDQRSRWVLTQLFICYLHAMTQRVPAAAILHRDFYMGALTYTERGAPPEENLIYIYGQEVNYGTPPAIAGVAGVDDKDDNTALGLTNWKTAENGRERERKKRTGRTLAIPAGRPSTDTSSSLSASSISDLSVTEPEQFSDKPDLHLSTSRNQITNPSPLRHRQTLSHYTLKPDTSGSQKSPVQHPTTPRHPPRPAQRAGQTGSAPPTSVNLPLHDPPASAPPSMSKVGSTGGSVRSRASSDGKRRSFDGALRFIAGGGGDKGSKPGSPLMNMFGGRDGRGGSGGGGACGGDDRSFCGAGGERPDAAQSALEVVHNLIANPVVFAPSPEDIPPIRLPPTYLSFFLLRSPLRLAHFWTSFGPLLVASDGFARRQDLTSVSRNGYTKALLTPNAPQRSRQNVVILLPHPNSNLPELPNNTNRLSSNRMFESVNFLNYVVDNSVIDPPAELVRSAIQELEASTEGGKPDDEMANTLTVLKLWGSEKATLAEKAAAEQGGEGAGEAGKIPGVVLL